ncbi:unannotated protein [freshwater metagenome]|uniref:Unannotated protein n=1 Tax=freshwater metagenome TaxID=449393 RepID=A0A6J7P5N6_9ZZZZ
MVVVALAGREDLVGRRHLVGVQHPLAVEAQRRRPTGDALVALDVFDLQVGPIDSEFVVGTSRHQDAHEDVVVGIAHVVAGRLLAHDQRLHVDTGHEVGRAEDDGLDPLARGGDGVDVGEPEGILDLRLDSDATHLKAVGPLDLRQQEVERHHLLGSLHLRKHDAVEVGAGAAHHLDNVGEGPLGGPVVDAHGADLAFVATLVEGRHDVLAGTGLGEGRHGVLEIHEDLVGGEPLGLVEHLGAATRHGKVGAA